MALVKALDFRTEPLQDLLPPELERRRYQAVVGGPGVG
jgi:hypothetical protein